jgi:Family of unknown function (DUF5856)
MEFSKFIKNLKESTDLKSSEELVEAVQGINDNSVGYLIPYALFMVAQTHLWHFLCPDGQKHMALGEFYEELEEEADSLAERFIAQGGQLQPFNVQFDMEYSDAKVYSAFAAFREVVSQCALQTDRAELRSIQDGVVDLQEVIDNKLYKFERN